MGIGMSYQRRIGDGGLRDSWMSVVIQSYGLEDEIKYLYIIQVHLLQLFVIASDPL